MSEVDNPFDTTDPEIKRELKVKMLKAFFYLLGLRVVANNDIETDLETYIEKRVERFSAIKSEFEFDPLLPNSASRGETGKAFIKIYGRQILQYLYSNDEQLENGTWRYLSIESWDFDFINIAGEFFIGIINGTISNPNEFFRAIRGINKEDFRDYEKINAEFHTYYNHVLGPEIKLYDQYLEQDEPSENEDLY